jgi:hypothetical protein
MIHTYQNADIAKWAKAAEEVNAFMALTYLPGAYATLAVDGILAASTTFYLSLHSASPSTSGANEILGSSQSGYSSGGYTGYRQTLQFAAASSGIQYSSDTQTFVLLATFASGIPYFGIWTAHDAGTYICGGPTSGLTGSIPNGASVIFTGTSASGSGVTISVQG